MSLLFTDSFAHENRKSVKYQEKKTTLTNEQKKEIIEYKKKNKTQTNVFIATLFSKKFKTEIDSRSVGNYLKDSSKIPEQSINAPKMTKGQVLKFKSIDEYMGAYIDKIGVKSGFINDKLIMKKTEIYAAKQGINNFTAPRGRFDKFKNRHGLKQRKHWGETHEIEEVNFDVFLTEITGAVEKYGQKNVYNIDETGLFTE